MGVWEYEHHIIHNCQLPTANCQLSTANRQLLTANRQLLTANRQLPTANCQLPTANCQPTPSASSKPDSQQLLSSFESSQFQSR
jgi:hypothetical protein